jgi:hypothetical protein
MTPNPVQAGSEVTFFHSEEPIVVGCEYNISPLVFNLPASGGGRTITIGTDAACEWFASDDRDWIEITSNVLGSGSSTINFTADANPGAARIGFIFLGGQDVRVNQRGRA